MKSNDNNPHSSRRYAILELGFRPFFLFAALYSIAATLSWFGIYVMQLQPTLPSMSDPAWHAHEMVFGYGAAVVAGFLLTATQNWTGLRTLHSTPLALLLALWLIPRIAPYVWPAAPLVLPAVFDIAFLTLLICALGWVILKSGNRKQMFILLLLVLLLLSNGLYYLGLAGVVPGGARTANFSGLYALLGLILILSRRVVPMFTERGVGYPVKLKNHAWVDRASMVLFVLFWIFELADLGDAPRALISGTLFLLHAFRLWGWYTHGIWKKPLVWVLHVAYAFLTIGFLLTLSSALTDMPSQLATHAFAYGGLGMMTLGMMSRVSIGHTGHNIHRPPGALTLAFGVLLAGSVVRVLAPIALPSQYVFWIALSQVLWVAAFAIFLITLAGTLVRPRIDGKPG